MTLNRLLLLAGVAVLLGGSFTKVFAVKFGSDAERFTFDGQRLGADAKKVLALASTKYTKEHTVYGTQDRCCRYKKSNKRAKLRVRLLAKCSIRWAKCS